MKELKQLIIDKCRELIDLRIDTNTKILKTLSESMAGETKSSAGDKFETSRAMLQADQDRHKSIVIKAKELRQKLSVISIQPSENIREGSLVVINGSKYFIAVGLGKVRVPELIYVISINSPIGKLMNGKSINDTFVFNNKTMVIQELY